MNVPVHARQFPLHWDAMIVEGTGENERVVYGRTHLISSAGVDIYTDSNLPPKGSVLLVLRLPGGGALKESESVEVKCSKVFVAAELDHFLVKLNFQAFSGEGQKKLLLAIKAHSPNNEY